MQFDRHGNRIWRDVKDLLDTEHARYAIGEVAVPYGRCAEPSNVAAGGGACPIRFRCAAATTSAPLGEHFRRVSDRGGARLYALVYVLRVTVFSRLASDGCI